MDARPFERIYDENHKAVHAYFLGRTGDAELALDLLQEVFLRVWRNYQSILDLSDDRRRWWVFTVAKNLLTDHFRRRPQPQALSEDLVLVDVNTTPDSVYEWNEAMGCLDRAIRKLPDELRTVLVMTVVGGCSSRQIADALGKPPGTVRYMLHRARRLLESDMGLMDGGTAI